MIPLPSPVHELHYRALGLVKGTLKPVPGSISQATLVTAEGDEYPVTPGRAQLLKQFTRCLERPYPHWFYVHPQPRPQNILGLSVLKILALSEAEWEALEQGDPDYQRPDPEDDFPAIMDGAEEGFNVRGDITSQRGVITATIQRKPQGDKQFSPLQVKIQGFLPGSQDGEFWDLMADREGHELVLVDGSRLLGAPQTSESA